MLSEDTEKLDVAPLLTSLQEALKLSTTQLDNLKQLNAETQSLLLESCPRFEKTSKSTVKNVNEAIKALKIDDFKYFIEESYDHVKTNSTKTIEDVASVVRFFYWKNLCVVLVTCIVMAVILSLYMNAEWPWEDHQTVVKERAAGKALMSAWPHLSKDGQALLQDKILKTSP